MLQQLAAGPVGDGRAGLLTVKCSAHRRSISQRGERADLQLHKL